MAPIQRDGLTNSTRTGRTAAADPMRANGIAVWAGVRGGATSFLAGGIITTNHHLAVASRGDYQGASSTARLPLPRRPTPKLFKMYQCGICAARRDWAGAGCWIFLVKAAECALAASGDPGQMGAHPSGPPCVPITLSSPAGIPGVHRRTPRMAQAWHHSDCFGTKWWALLQCWTNSLQRNHHLVYLGSFLLIR
ncbi:hypothetical protein BD779DRAFT_1473565 [Infundibulicybe gibba]|nr:hypothetical protein BD779DRAFT_1473565 [Infundibulicybe gibba]